MIKKRKGLVLIAAIMLIVFVSIAVLGLAVFIVQWFKQLSTDQIRAKCLYLAQAGIQDAIYRVRSTYLKPGTTYGSYATGLTPVDIGETYCRGVSFPNPALAGAADFLMVNTVTSILAGAAVSGAKYQKATSSALPVVTIDRMIIEWVKTGAVRYLRQITLNGVNVFTSVANNVSGYNADITNTTYSTTNYSVLTNSLTFSGSMTGLTWLDVTYIMTDGSSKKVRLYPASNSCQFAVNSTGKVASSNIYRTIKATYDLMPTTYATTSRIVDIDEINAEVTPP